LPFHQRAVGNQGAVRLPVVIVAHRQPLGLQPLFDLAAKGGIADRGTIGRDDGKHRACDAILQAGHGKHSLIFLFAGHQRRFAVDYGLRVLHLSCKDGLPINGSPGTPQCPLI
jgi:hypothetical protein